MSPDDERAELIRHLRSVGWLADFETWPDASLIWLYQHNRRPR